MSVPHNRQSLPHMPSVRPSRPTSAGRRWWWGPLHVNQTRRAKSLVVPFNNLNWQHTNNSAAQTQSRTWIVNVPRCASSLLGCTCIAGWPGSPLLDWLAVQVHLNLSCSCSSGTLAAERTTIPSPSALNANCKARPWLWLHLNYFISSPSNPRHPPVYRVCGQNSDNLQICN